MHSIARIAIALSLGFTLSAHAQQPAKKRVITVTEREKTIGDAPANPGPLATDLSPALRSADVKAAMRKVADWQYERIKNAPSQNWTFPPLYDGFLATSKTLHDPKYHDNVVAVGEHFHWTIGVGNLATNANEHALGYPYILLYEEDHDPKRIADLKREFEDIRNDPPPSTEKDPHFGITWWWCDALFMAPPAWTALSRVTHDPRYVDFMDKQWHATDKLLWSEKDHLYFRDRSFLDKKQKNGEHIFWSRGNGWVMGGLVGVLENMPKHDIGREFYVDRLKQMSDKLLSVQGKDGLWRTGLLDAAAYEHPEISGSAFNLYAMAWGVNHGILPRKRYLPAIALGWKGMLEHIYADGRLGSIQPIGDSPGIYPASSSYVYGTGAFLLAGSEIEKLAKR
ncbi:MAG: glycoside hydrolase family 88 protein [Acidobacteria bacterium]|nr:glycoside hydrolase family 88 protein [Acidobacteriota bacterium]